jgi:hypothetical protein
MRSGGSRWARWGGAVAFVALLAGAGLWRFASPRAPQAEPVAKPSPSRPVEVRSDKEPAPPRYRVERVEGPSGAPVEVARADAERTSLARFAADAVVPLTPEEEALLKAEPVDDPGELVARTERDFRQATPETREEKERRYLLALNLAAKLAPRETPGPDVQAREAQARYLQALAAEQAKWAGRPPDEQRRLQDAFKDDFFRKQGERQ